MSEIYLRIGRKYVAVIPSGVRKELRLREGDILRLRLEGKRLILERPEDSFDVLAETVGEPYSETSEEKRAEAWLINSYCLP